MLVHMLLLYDKGMRKEKNDGIEKTLYRGQDVVGQNCSFLTENVISSGGAEFCRKVAGSLLSGHLPSAAGTHQLYVHPPSLTVCLFH